MNFGVIENATICCNVLSVKTFDRKSGEKGQVITVLTDKGYQCKLDAVDVNVCDFSNLQGVCKLSVKPLLSYDHFLSSSGKDYYKNFGSFIVAGVVSLPSAEIEL